MYYSDETVEMVRSRNDIVDVIGSYVRLKKKGSSYFGLCPFHNEKSPSFSVSGDKQMFYCFGCGVGGNVFTFIMNYENFSFGEAMTYLAERAGVELPRQDNSAENRRQADEKAKLLEIHKEAARYYYAQLRAPGGEAAMAYFQKRGLSPEIMKSFGLGYTGKAGDGLYRYLRGKGYDDSILAASRLVRMDERRGPQDTFWNRVMFPIMDGNRRVIAFGGRVMGDGNPKYLNSPETKIFDKSRNLYGIDKARTARTKTMILCEGYMDVIAMHQAGFSNAVASLGTAFTSGHASLVKRYASEALLIYDSDDAGVKAALRAIPILREAGLGARVVDLSPYKDPDEFIKNLGKEEFQKRLDNAQNSFLFEIDVLKRGYDLSDPTSKTDFYRAVADKLLAFPDALERKAYTEAAAAQLFVSFDELNRMVNSQGLRKGTAAPVERPRATSFGKPDKDEGIKKTQRLLITWLTEREDLFDTVEQYVQPEDFTVELYRDVAGRLYDQHREGHVNPAQIISAYEDEEQQRQVAELFHTKLEQPPDEKEQYKALEEIIYKVREESLRQEKASMNLADMNAMQRFIKRKQDLDRLKRAHIFKR